MNEIKVREKERERGCCGLCARTITRMKKEVRILLKGHRSKRTGRLIYRRIPREGKNYERNATGHSYP